MRGPISIFFHDNCLDGSAAALIASNVLLREEGSSVDLVPVQYGDEAPDVTGKHVYVLDFSWPRPEMERMHKQAASLTVLDHHKTAKDELRGLDFCTFDMGKSGARLAHEHFEGHLDAPWWVEYIEDRDLWRWALPDSKAVNAAIRSYGLGVGALQGVLRMYSGPEILAQEGRAILRYQEQVIDQHLGHADAETIAGVQVPCVNATVLFSEIVGELAKGNPFAASFFVKADGSRVYQLRSTPDGMDVSEIAKKYGGGGHRHAAGFTMRGPISDPPDID